ncbi:hypothetical protein niasHS_003280 [Heterodera schachtii]|uniref:Transmembrane protein n=1 Tax=Heterodera schachtii TaxID=97005 RepID=A0ABD2KG51_HETSC
MNCSVPLHFLPFSLFVQLSVAADDFRSPTTISHFSSAKMRFSLLFSVLSLLFLLFASIGAFPRADFVRISKRQVVVKDTNDLPKWYGK